MVSDSDVSASAHTEAGSDFRAMTAQTKVSPSPAWRRRIDAASTHEEIVAVLRLCGLRAVADRLSRLRKLLNDDPEEPSLEFESLRALAIFLLTERHLPDPQIGVSPDGLAHVEWRTRANGVLAMEFLSSELIRFAAVSAPARLGIERLTVNGALPQDAALDAVQSFTSRL